MTSRRGIYSLLLIPYLMSCAVGRKMAYDNETIDMDYKPARSMAVAFYDQRKEILNAKEKPGFTGHIKSTVQIAYNVQTKSGHSLADDFANSISTSLAAKGVRSGVVSLEHQDSLVTLMNSFKGLDFDRLLVFTINQWEVEGKPGWVDVTNKATGDFTLNVYDKQGNLLATVSAKDGVEEKGGAAVSVKALQSLADTLFKKLMMQLLNDATVKAVLQ